MTVKLLASSDEGMRKMKIWQLCFNVDEYDNFIPISKLSADELQSIDGRSLINTNKLFSVKRMEPEKNLELGDAPGFIMPVFSSHALKILEPLIKCSIEAIPLKDEGTGYYAINIISVLDVIDYSKSKYRMFSDEKRIMAFQKYAFIENNNLKEHNIFKIIDEPRRYPFVSEKFKETVEANSLKGFIFKLVWESD